MIGKWVRAGMFAAGAVALAVAGGAGSAQAKADKKLTIGEIMKKGHAGAKSLMKGIGAQAKADKWDDAKEGASTLKTFGEALGGLPPNKGSAESWKKLTDKYKDQTAAVYEAVDKKDAKATGAALGVLNKSCGECHKAHKED